MKKIYGTLGLRLLIAFLPPMELHAQSACSGAPGANAVLASQTIVCPGSTVSLSLLNSYTVTGLTCQWRSSTISPVGPYTNLPGATLNTYTTNPLFTSTYFQCVITCTNVNQNTTANYVHVLVAPALTTSTVPYYEGFEGISFNNQLPNCSWLAATIGTTVGTYTSSQSNNRVPRSGTNFAAFANPAFFAPTSTNNIVYTNGIQMNPGITYSAGVYFSTDYMGWTTWSLEMMVGPNQSTIGLAPVASISPAVSGPYQLLSGTFTVPSSGFYYVAIRAKTSGSNGFFLSWDDLSVTAPCSLAGNSSTITIAPNNFTVCDGEVVTFTASGANSYTWSTGAVGPVYTATVSIPFSLSVSSSNTLSACISTRNVTVSVNPNPNIFAVASPPAVCPGETVVITGYGTSASTLLPGPSTVIPGTSMILVSPTVTTCYTLTGANTSICGAKSSVCVTVHPLPTITAMYSPSDICAGEEVVLTGSGAMTYQWWNGFSPGNPVKAYPLTSTVYSITGTNANGCKNTSTISVKVNECTGVNEFVKSPAGFFIHPNPNAGELIISSLYYVSGFKVCIRDAIGRTVLLQETKEAWMTIDFHFLPRGVYYSVIEYSGSVNVIKLVRE